MLIDLLHSSYFSLFLIVALGFMLGRIKIKGLSLDVSAVIFIALLFGHFGVIIPKELGNFGLVLFIFTIGIQAGPGFFDSFRSKGKTLILITMLIICSACLTAVGLKYAFDIDTPSVVGLIAGALTSTPGLAVAIDSTNSPLASIAYGIAYPFGVIGVILFVKLLPKIMRVDLDKEARRLELERRSGFPELTTCIFRVTNQAVFGRTLAQINARAMTGAVISRVKHEDSILMPKANTMLLEGDYVQAVGSEEALNQFAVLVGELEEGELPLDQTQEIESLLLTKKDMINKQLGDLNLQRNFGCTVTRIRRSGIDLSPSPDLALKFGDKLMVVGEREGLRGVARLLGNNAKQLSDTDFFPLSAQQFPDNSLEVFNQSDEAIKVALATLSTPNRLLSYFGRAQYEYDNRYLLTASIRRDGSSRFGKNNRWGMFPAVSAAYRISNEKFWPEKFVVNQMKIRGSWGMNGNNSISTNAAIGLMGSSNYSIGGSLTNGFAPCSIDNKELGWEKTHSWNVGLDLGFFDNRITLAADYYDKTTKDLLYQVSVPGTMGFTQAWGNIGSIKNKGFEIELTTQNLTGRFKWTTSLNIAYNKNKVLSLGEDNSTVFIGWDKSNTQVPCRIPFHRSCQHRS